MTDLDTQTRMRQLTYVWMLLAAGLLVIIAALASENIHLRVELAKPARLTYVEKMKIVGDYLADGETRFALRQQIGCKEKE